MSGSYRRRDWADEVGAGTETVSVQKQLELWACSLRGRSKMEISQEATAITETCAAVLAVGGEIVDQLTQITEALQVMLETGDYRAPGVTSGAVAGTDCQPEDDESAR